MIEKTPKDWWKSFFVPEFYTPADEAHLFYAPAEARFAFKQLKLKRNSSLLDLCCGPGRHAHLIARRNVRVTGLDQSRAYLEEARLLSHGIRIPPAFVHGDMRKLPFGADSFDAVMNMFTSFGYFAKNADNLKVLRGVRRVLKPGGYFLLDVLHREWLIKNFTRRDWSDLGDGKFFLEERKLSKDKMKASHRWIRLFASGRSLERVFTIHIFNKSRISKMLVKAGLTPLRFWGGFSGERLSADANRMVVLARKSL